MPNRILRDWTDSRKIEQLCPNSERLFSRLIMKADDFGRYHADVRLVRAGCFPLLNFLRDTDISHWIAACKKAGLIVVYRVQGCEYLAIVNFRQRIREGASKFPAPDGMPNDWLPDDSQLTVNCQSYDGQLTAYAESKAHAKAQAQTGGKSPPTPPPNAVGSTAHPKSVENFADFWVQWPDHHRKSGRSKCEKLWNSRNLDRISELIFSSLRLHKISEKWLEQNGRFIPGPHRWLNEEMWEAKPTTSATCNDFTSPDYVPPPLTPEQEKVLREAEENP